MANDREELAELRRMEELEAKAAGQPMGVQPVLDQANRRFVAREQVENDPLSVNARFTSRETTQPRWFGGNPDASKAQRVAAGPVMQFAQGAASPFIGGAQLLANTSGVGADTVNNLVTTGAEMAQQGGAGGFNPFNIAGQVLSPANLMIARGMAPTATAGQRIGQGAAAGFATSAMAPVAGAASREEFDRQKLAQVGGGTVAGAVLPAAWEGAKGTGRLVRNVVQPFTGSTAPAGRLLNNMAGDRRPGVLAALDNPQQTVPGAMPTAGQAATPAGSAEFSAMQRIAAQRDPSGYADIQRAQNAARANAVRQFAGTPLALDTATAARGAAATQNYGNAFAQATRANPELAQLASNPFFKDEVGGALKLAEAAGINPKTDLTQFLHFVKIGLDKQLSKTGNDALSNTQKRAVEGVKNDLVGWLAKNNPAYEGARSAFAAQSGPINQMQVGQELLGRLEPVLAGQPNQRAQMFASALRDSSNTVQKAGGPRYQSVSDALTPQNMAAARGVEADLARSGEMSSLAQAGEGEAMRIIGAQIPKAGSTGAFNPQLSAARAVYNAFTGKATDRVLKQVAEIMKDPAKTAEVMRKATPAQRKVMVDMLMRGQAVAAPAVPDALAGMTQQ